MKYLPPFVQTNRLHRDGHNQTSWTTDLGIFCCFANPCA
jgi:hypothetical protein